MCSKLRLIASTDLMSQPAVSQIGPPLPRWQVMPQSPLQQALSSLLVRQSLTQRHLDPQSLRLRSWLQGHWRPRLQARQTRRLRAQMRQVCLQRGSSG